MTNVFIALAVLSFLGIGINAARRHSHGMMYSAACVVLWVFAALWSSGAFK